MKTGVLSIVSPPPLPASQGSLRSSIQIALNRPVFPLAKPPVSPIEVKTGFPKITHLKTVHSGRSVLIKRGNPGSYRARMGCAWEQPSMGVVQWPGSRYAQIRCPFLFNRATAPDPFPENISPGINEKNRFGLPTDGCPIVLNFYLHFGT